MKASITKNKYISLLFFIIFLGIWQCLSMIYSEIIVPSPAAAFLAVGEIILSGDIIEEGLITFFRLLIGVILAFVIAIILGIFMGLNQNIRNFFIPMVNMIQATPPISWLVLAIIWFGLNGKASSFIVFVSTLPIILINLLEGFKNIDKHLLDMAKSFRLNKMQIIFHIIIPSIIPYLKSGVNIAIGVGWKVVVMGEVLSASSGIGAKITNARLNIETDKVVAWTIIIILMCYLSQKILWVIFYSKSKRRKIG